MADYPTDHYEGVSSHFRLMAAHAHLETESTEGQLRQLEDELRIHEKLKEKRATDLQWKTTCFKKLVVFLCRHCSSLQTNEENLCFRLC